MRFIKNIKKLVVVIDINKIIFYSIYRMDYQL